MKGINHQELKIYSELIESDPYEVCREVSTILHRLESNYGIDTDQCFDIRVILSELLQNAIKHGNDSDQRKKIRVDVWLQDNSQVLGITVMDQGAGFDPVRTMRHKSCRISASDPMEMDESGRGLLIVKNLCDDMEFNAPGNSITIRKRL